MATQDDPEQFQRLLSCLVEGNQIWAKAAPVLALGVVSLRFALNAQDNRAAIHDLGLAAGLLEGEPGTVGRVLRLRDEGRLDDEGDCCFVFHVAGVTGRSGSP